MNHGSLFSGIGGFDLAAKWMGWENIFHCEWNGFGQKVLKYYWPNAISYGDITKTDFTIWRGRIDIITGGFPCQPYSLAGKRKGKADDRHLWPEMFRAIREIQPLWVVGENVPGLITWSGGLVFEEVQTALEDEGYEVQSFVLPACGVNAPHRRDRVWFVAYARNFAGGSAERCSDKRGWQFLPNKQQGGEIRSEDAGCGSERATPDTARTIECTTWNNFPTQSPLCNRDDGISSRLSGITFPKWRNESIRAMGNAIVPQVAYQIFKVIDEMNSINNDTY